MWGNTMVILADCDKTQHKEGQFKIENITICVKNHTLIQSGGQWAAK